MALSIERSSATACCLLTGGPCRTSNNAALPPAAVRSISVINVSNSATVITPARTAIVPSAATTKPLPGCKRNSIYCCPLITSSSPSPCPPSCAVWPAVTKGPSTTCYFAQLGGQGEGDEEV